MSPIVSCTSDKIVIIVLISISVRVVQAAFSVTPLNTVSAAGPTTTLQCTTNASLAGWTLFFLNGSSCPVSSGTAIQTGCVDPSRYTITPGTSGQFDLNIANTRPSDAGTYRCEEIGINPLLHAYAVYGVVASSPSIVQSPSADCVFGGDTVTLSCHVTYSGNSLVPIVMTWSGGTPGVVNSTTGTFQSNYSITASTSIVPSYTCTVTFNAPTASTIPPTAGSPSGSTNAINAPNYTQSVQSQTYPVQVCPDSITITPAGEHFGEGAELTCNVTDGNAKMSASYTWINASNGGTPVSNGQSVPLTVGLYNLTCVATLSNQCTGSQKKCPELNTFVSVNVTANNDGGGSSNALALGLGIGLGVGIPVLAAAIGLIAYKVYKKGESDKASTGSSDKITSNARANPAYTPDQTILASPGQGLGYLDPPPDVLSSKPPHPGASRPYHQPTGYQSTPTKYSQPLASPEGIIYAELSQQAPRSRNPVTPTSNTEYASIARA